LCVLPAISSQAQGGEHDGGVQESPGGTLSNGAQGGAAAGAAAHEAMTFAGEPSLGGAFSRGYDPRACRQLYLPLVVSSDFRPARVDEGSSQACVANRAPYAAGDCFALPWPAGGADTIAWKALRLGAQCLEAGAARVRFQAHVDSTAQVMRFKVADGVETLPLTLTIDWAQFDIDVSSLDHERFDVPDASEPQGLVAFAVTPAQPLTVATTLFVDDVRWVRSSAPEGTSP
jgi:hypothetical protein